MFFGEFDSGKRANKPNNESIHIVVKLEISIFELSTTIFPRRVALFDSDGEFSFSIGAFGSVRAPLEPEAIMEWSRAGTAKGER